MANEVIKNDTAITLDWASVSGATNYHVQVSESPDFSGVFTHENATLVPSTVSFTDGGTNDSRRYWRWRSSADNGVSWNEWSEVGSYWLSTSASADVLLDDEWTLINPSDVADQYTLPCFPLYTIQKNLIARLKQRNRLGTLLTDYVTVKDNISLFFDQNAWITHEQMRAIYRFHTEVKTFFLATMKSNGVDDVPNIWKVQFTGDPSLSMIAAGRQDMLIGDITLEEV